MKSVHIVGSQGTCQYAQMFIERGWQVINRYTPDVDLVQFTGGSDVSPLLYGEPNVESYNSWVRDVSEMLMFGKRLDDGGAMAGICRGGQFLNVMCGGSMWQDVDGHIGSHVVRDIETTEMYLATSTHHQMMRPGPKGHVLAVADNRSKIKTSAYDELDNLPDIEAVLYQNQKALCFQPHPEFGSEELKDWYFRYLRTVV